MSKNTISIIIFVILLVFFLNAFSTSYTSHNIPNLAYVLALGIDVGENAKIKLSAQFTKTAVFNSSSGSSPDDSDSIVLVSGESDSVFSALNLLNTYIGKEINLAHCYVIAFSDEFAKNGISSEIYSFINNEEIRPITNLVVTKSTAYDYLNNVKPNLEKVTAKYYETFELTSKLTGYISNISIGDFYNDLCSNTCDSTAILAGLNATARKEDEAKSTDSNSTESNSSDSNSSSDNTSSSSDMSSSTDSKLPQNVITNSEDLVAGTSSVMGKRGTENIGIAVFNNDKFCGELTTMETLCHLLINNNVDSGIISIDNPLDTTKKIELQLIPTKKSKVNVEMNNDKMHISVDIKVEADITTLEENIDYSSKQNLEKISEAAEIYLQEQFHNYFNKVSREYKSDIDDFCSKALSYFATIPELKNSNLKEKYINSDFDINVDVNVASSLLLTKTQ